MCSIILIGLKVWAYDHGILSIVVGSYIPLTGNGDEQNHLNSICLPKKNSQTLYDMNRIY